MSVMRTAAAAAAAAAADWHNEPTDEGRMKERERSSEGGWLAGPRDSRLCSVDQGGGDDVWVCVYFCVVVVFFFLLLLLLFWKRLTRETD